MARPVLQLYSCCCRAQLAFFQFWHWACVAANDPAANIKEIRVASYWQGWGYKHSDLVIRRDGPSFRAEGRELNSTAVSRLIAALLAAPIAVPDAINLGFTREWLARNSDPGKQDIAGELYNEGTARQKALYIASFQNPEIIQKLAPLICRDSHTDDDPRVEVDILSEDGRKLAGYSQTQGAFLLPWVVERGGRQITTYNADISRAVAELLPDQFTNRSRLAGQGVKELLSDVVMISIGDHWDFAGAEDKAPDAIARLRTLFLLKTATFDPPNVFRATLARSRWPKNFTIAPVLPFRENRVEGVNALLRESPTYAARALAVPWLVSYLAKDDRAEAELEYTDDSSFSRKDLQDFNADMVGVGKSKLAARIAPIRKEIALIQIAERRRLALPADLKFEWQVYRHRIDPIVSSRWLVLPSGETVLWRYAGDTDSLPLRNLDQKIHSCAAYPKWDACVGAVLSPEGKLH